MFDISLICNITMGKKKVLKSKHKCRNIVSLNYVTNAPWPPSGGELGERKVITVPDSVAG